MREQGTVTDEFGEMLSFVSGVCNDVCFVTQTVINGKVYSFIDTEKGRRLPVIGVDSDKLVSQQKLMQSVRDYIEVAGIKPECDETDICPPLQYSKL